MKTLIYNLVKLIIRLNLFFYFKKISVSGKKQIPKKGAVVFLANHPNGLIDPLVITCNIPRANYYLVRAAVFKNPLVKKMLGYLNLMPVYRIRDGLRNLKKNDAIFNTCFTLLKNKKSILIFPEGSHNRKRTIRPISKGFTRIVFGTLERYPNTNITIIPVGLTYQNASEHPTTVALKFGQPIVVNTYYNVLDINKSTLDLKAAVTKQLQNLSAHIPDNNNYYKTLAHLNAAQVNFTAVKKVNNFIKNNTVLPVKPAKSNHLKWLYYIIIGNTIIPFIIWKIIRKKIDEIEFIDTFRFSAAIVMCPIWYTLLTVTIYKVFGLQYALLYAFLSVFSILIYTKLSPTPTEKSTF